MTKPFDLRELRSRLRAVLRRTGAGREIVVPVAGAGDASGFAPPDIGVLQTLIDAVPARAVFVDLDHHYRYVNREFLDFVNLPAEEVIGRHVADIVGQAVYDSYGNVIAKVHAGETVVWEGWVDYGALGRRYVHENLMPYASASGEVQGIIAIGLDLTDHKLRETELAERLEAQTAVERLSSAIIASALNCIIVIDSDGKVVEFNPAAEATFGYGMDRYLRSGRASVLGRRVEIEAMRANGEIFPVELAITEVDRPNQRLFTAHIRDLTEARQAQAEIERQRDALHQSEKLAALGSLLAGVAHELNNPLSIVTGQALMLRETASVPVLHETDIRNIAERSAKIEAAAERCARIVRTFLAMARQRAAERREVEIPALIDGAVDQLGYGLRTAGIDLVKEVQHGLPRVWADEDQLHQILVNLIVNAKQALEEGSGTRRITISARHDPSTPEVLLTVTDDGPGVPEEIRSRIFDPFFTTKPQGVGTGVGLAVSRGLIEAQGGTLTLLPGRPGVGASFVIRIPLGSGAGGAVAAKEEPVAVTPAKPKRALIVDDEEEIAGILAELLSRHDFACDIALSEAEARNRVGASTGGYDVILCDVRMPEGDGPSLFHWLEQEKPQLARRIGFVTGDTLGPAAGRFLERTGCPAIEKPFSAEDISRLVRILSDRDIA